jgi:hypothetical protein
MLFLAGTSALWKQGTSSRWRGKDMLHSGKLILKVTSAAAAAAAVASEQP